MHKRTVYIMWKVMFKVQHDSAYDYQSLDMKQF